MNGAGAEETAVIFYLVRGLCKISNENGELF
jgi:hypothetical protein